VVAAQRNPIRIPNRGHCREPVERAAQHDRQKAGVAPFGTRELRQIRPGEQSARSEQQFPARWCVAFGHDLSPQELWRHQQQDEGLRATFRASDGVARLGRRQRAEPRLDKRDRIQPVSDAASEIAGYIDALRQAVDPCRLVLSEAVWSRRTPQRLAKQRLPAHDTADYPWRTREAQRGYDPLGWTLELRALGRP